MKSYQEMTLQECQKEYQKVKTQYEELQKKQLHLDLSRGKPSPDQLDLSMDMLDIRTWRDREGVDCRNYGGAFGIDEMRSFWSQITGIPKEQIIVGGNSSLNMMFDELTRCMLFGTAKSQKPWCQEEHLKFLCLVPGYDRHFRVTETLGFELLSVPMTQEGPDMDIVERLVQDPTVKGMWCVPKYSNPTGITYSDEVVRRIAKMKCAAEDFVCMWDNAYAVHDFVKEGDRLLNIFDVAKEYGTEDRFFYFSSTSKITFPGAGIAMMAASNANIAKVKPIISSQTIGPDKLNQLHHLVFLPDADALKAHMARHAAIIAPKFQELLARFDADLKETGIATWTNPHGGYFVSLDLLEGCAKETYNKCKAAGLTLTPAGACFPYGIDPKDSNLRIAPTYCKLEELSDAVSILTCSVRLVALEKLMREYV